MVHKNAYLRPQGGRPGVAPLRVGHLVFSDKSEAGPGIGECCEEQGRYASCPQRRRDAGRGEIMWGKHGNLRTYVRMHPGFLHNGEQPRWRKHCLAMKYAKVRSYGRYFVS